MSNKDSLAYEYAKIMKAIVLFFCLLLGCLSISAKTTHPWNETQEQKYQRLINLDYSIPDYNVSRPDANVIGWRLAGILQFLEANYKQGMYNQMMAQLRNRQMGDLATRYLPVDKMTVKYIEKQDSIITITINTFSKTEKKKKIDFDVKLVFTNSLCDDDVANELFSDIGRFVKKGDE